MDETPDIEVDWDYVNEGVPLDAAGRPVPPLTADKAPEVRRG